MGFTTSIRGSDALLLWGADGASRVLLSSGEGSDLGWRVPVLEVLEGGWPWLALWPFAVVLAWKQRHLSSGRWTLGLQLAMAVAVLPLRTQLPWYSHILWLPFALLCGPALAELVQSGRPRAPFLSYGWCWGSCCCQQGSYCLNSALCCCQLVELC